MSHLDLNNLSNYVQWFGSFFITVLAFRKGWPALNEIRIVGLLGLTSFVMQALQQACGVLWSMNYLNSIGDTFVFFEALLLAALYFPAINHKAFKLFIWLFITVFCIIFVFVLINANYPWYSVLSTTKSIFAIVCALLFFSKIFINLPENNLLTLPMFWVNSAILFYFSCSFILSLTVSYLVDVLKDDLSIYWSFRNFLRAFFCGIICIGLWQAHKQIPYSTKNTG